MGLTREFYRYSPLGWCNGVASGSSNLVWVAPEHYAVGAAEQVFLWNIKTGQKVGHCSGTSPVTVLEASSARGLLSVGYADGAVKIFNLSSPSPDPILIFSGHKSAVTALAFSSDGLQLASGGRDSAVIVWDVVGETGLFRLNGHKGHITRLRFTANSHFLLSSSKDSFIKFWDLGSQHCFYTLADHRSEVWDFALSEEDTRLVTGSVESELRLYQLQWKQDSDPAQDGADEIETTLKRLRTSDEKELNANEQGTDVVRVRKVGQSLRRAKGRVTQVLHSPDGLLFLALGTGNLCDVYRVYNADESRKRIQKKIRKRKKLNVSEGVRVEELIEEVSRDITTQIVRVGEFRPPKGAKLKALAFNTPKVRREDYKVCAVLSTNELCEFSLQLESEKELKGWRVDGRGVSQPGHRGEVRGLCFSSDDQALLSTAPESLKVWNRSSLEPVRTLSVEEGAACVTGVFLPGDRHALLGRKDGALEVWDIAGARCLHRLPHAHSDTVWALRVSPDQKYVASGSADKTVKMWSFAMLPSEFEKDRKVLSLAHSGTLELTEEVMCLQLSPNGKFLAVGLLDNTARVYFVDTLKFFLSLYGHSLPVLCLDISWDSKLVITGSADKNVKIWGLDFGDCHRSLFAHDDSVTAVSFIAKSHLFFSVGKDGKVKQWDADKFQKIQVLEEHHGEVWALAVSGKGQWVGSASHDRTIRLWEETEELVVLEETEELEREAEAETEMLEQADVVPGESAGESGLAAKRTMDSVKAAENIIDASNIRNQHFAALVEDPKAPPHPMMVALKSKNADFFVMDVIRRIRSSELERSLVMVPFGVCLEVMGAMRVCVEKGHCTELAARVIFFLLRIHHSQVISSPVGAELVESLAHSVPASIASTRDRVGFNLAALTLLQQAVEEKEEVQIFADATTRLKEKKKKKKVQDTYIMTVS